jgi:hypothetical protein
MKFKKGGSGIYIKPENRGKFTATKKATGKTTEELTHSKNPITKKRAIFAQNAAKWKHEDGSKGVKSFPDLNKDGKVSRADVLVGRGVIPAKKMQKGNKKTKTKYTEEENKRYLQKAGGYVKSPDEFKERGIPEVGPPIRKGASADSTHYFSKKIYDLKNMEEGVIREMNDRKAPKTKIPKEVEDRKLSKSDEFAHKYLTSQPRLLSKIRAAKDEAKDNYFRQENKGNKGVIFNYDKDGHFIGPKFSDKKMCGSKGMKYQIGTRSTKATPDSTSYYKRKYVEESLKRPRGKYSVFSEENFKVNRKLDKYSQDIDRQQLKGKPGYDKNGYPLKKGVKERTGASGDFANGTKNIKFKKPMMKRADGSYSQRGLWDNIRANKGSGKKPTPEMLKQERKIKAGK